MIPPTLLEILALSLTNGFSLTKLQLSQKPVTITFNFAVSGLTSIRQLPMSLLHLSFTPNLSSIILSAVIKPVSSRSRTLLLVLSLKLTILRSLHWLRISTRIEYTSLSLTYKVLTTTQRPYLHNFISVQRPRSTCSSSVVTLARLPSSSSLKITDRSFHYASPCLWSQLPLSLPLPHSSNSSSISDSPIPSPITSSSSYSPLCLSLLLLSFTPGLKPISFTNPP